MSRDRRDSYRFEIDAGDVCLSLSPLEPEARVVELSASGCSIVGPTGLVESLSNSPAFLQVGRYPPFYTRVVPVRTAQGTGPARTGVRFGQLDRKALGSLSRFLIDRFREQSSRLSSLVEEAKLSIGNFQRDLVCKLLLFHAISHGRRLRVYRGNLRLPLLLRVREMTVEAARQLIVAEVLGGAAEMLRRGQEYTFGFRGANALNYFRTEVWRHGPGEVMILLPPHIRQTGFRESFRIRLSPDQSFEASFDHPRLPGSKLRKRVLEISAQGLSFLLDLEHDLLFPGDRIRQILLDLSEGPVRAQAAVRSILPDHEGSGLACGIELSSFYGEEEAERWRRFVLYAGYPRIRLGERNLVNTYWGVLEASRYLEETTAATRPSKAKSFFVSWTRHSDKTWLSRYLLIYKGDHPIGTVAANLIYPDTWLVHHLGIDERERKADRQGLFEIAREAYCGMQHILGNMTPLKYFVIYADAGKAWNEMIFDKFLRRYSNKEDFLYDGYRVYKCLPQLETYRPAATGSVEVVDGNSKLLRLLSRHQRANLPEVEYEAFCYGKEEIALDDFSRKCSRNGYERERRIFFAVDGGDVLAALVAETGEEGINIFGLLNKCWFVYITRQMARYDQAKGKLLLEAIRFYEEKCKNEFILIGSPYGESEDLLEPLGFFYVADGFRFLARRTVIPAWMSYVDESMRMLSG